MVKVALVFASFFLCLGRWLQVRQWRFVRFVEWELIDDLCFDSKLLGGDEGLGGVLGQSNRLIGELFGC